MASSRARSSSAASKKSVSKAAPCVVATLEDNSEIVVQGAKAVDMAKGDASKNAASITKDLGKARDNAAKAVSLVSQLSGEGIAVEISPMVCIRTEESPLSSCVCAYVLTMKGEEVLTAKALKKRVAWLQAAGTSEEHKKLIKKHDHDAWLACAEAMQTKDGAKVEETPPKGRSSVSAPVESEAGVEAMAAELGKLQKKNKRLEAAIALRSEEMGAAGELEDAAAKKAREELVEIWSSLREMCVQHESETAGLSSAYESLRECAEQEIKATHQEKGDAEVAQKKANYKCKQELAEMRNKLTTEENTAAELRLGKLKTMGASTGSTASADEAGKLIDMINASFDNVLGKVGGLHADLKKWGGDILEEDQKAPTKPTPVVKSSLLRNSLKMPALGP